MFLLGEKSIHLAQIVIIYVLAMTVKAQDTKGTWNVFLFGSTVNLSLTGFF